MRMVVVILGRRIGWCGFVVPSFPECCGVGVGDYLVVVQDTGKAGRQS